MDDTLERVKSSHCRNDPLEEQLKFYDAWAPCFEQDAACLKYGAPKFCIEVLKQVMQKQGKSPLHLMTGRIIDFAAGTGLVGEKLREAGFTGEMDAQDGSEKMLDVAKGKLIYRNFFQCLIEPGKKMQIPLSCYDVAFLVGALSDNQVQPECLEILLPHIRVGGYFTFSTRSNRSNLQYKTRLEEVINRMVREGVWEKVVVQDFEEFEISSGDESTSSKYVDGSNTLIPFIGGTVYCYKKVKDF